MDFDRISRRKFTRSFLMASGAAFIAGRCGNQAFAEEQSQTGDSHFPDLGTMQKLQGAARKITLAWSADSICTVAFPVAQAKGFFSKYNLDVNFIDFAGSVDQMLETMSTGKADGASGMALRWLKPLQQGFDVKLVAGLHSGCLHLLASGTSSIKNLADLKGKTIGVGDIGGPAKNFFSMRFREIGIDPEKDVNWRQFPSDILPLAIKRQAVQAAGLDDPLAYLLKQEHHLVTIDSNMSGEWAKIACCVVGLRGSLIRKDPLVGKALTQAILEAGQWVHHNKEEAAEIFKPYAPKATVGQLTEILESEGTHQQVIGSNLRQNVSFYAQQLKQIGVFPLSLDINAYADKVTEDIFAL
ncbi:ABC transporter substrate-binding protein [Commensalibacter sp. M0357]|uniref:ABC transporter substrate-binding protein n=1 Tax=Commensalibacter TaxID=1079922 RepID=UPI0012D9173E|nr:MULTISPECIES: ABC transporter substrate-binding protein [Commensalibacter]MCT6842756.1 ABC transporter substrate-binding protein [Commensalibacter sp.]MBI0075086.1 ABC transporter substrate-binding protein [Commensalibacter sp. M0357]MBI0084928.1 ABC transporter substrate-binding protein [Commensalibacter sp. M0355]MCT6852617.1 ABC transporter substrate-binding protein [Commensalibacter sp.]MUG77393.1 ABC transporter substrate-binding protein [Commensalibacter melissae]